MGYAYFYESPIGKVLIGEENSKITHVLLKGDSPQPEYVLKETPVLAEAGRQLKEYFDGRRTEFDLELNPSGTEFMKKVWEALLKIPYGETRSYKDIALSIDRHKACRAVGIANNRNPIPIIIPCHRVIGADGSLVGYGGGLDTKIFLLELEKAHKPR